MIRDLMDITPEQDINLVFETMKTELIDYEENEQNKNNKNHE